MKPTPASVIITSDGSADHLERLGWHGIGVSAPSATSRSYYADAFLAAANDPEDGMPALSVWAPVDGGTERLIAFWLTPAEARKVAKKLNQLAAIAEEIPVHQVEQSGT